MAIRDVFPPVWLIEAGGVWWTGRSLDRCNAFGAVQDALQFARQEDAERVRCYLLPPEVGRICRTTEHLFLPGLDPAAGRPDAGAIPEDVR